MSVAQRRFGPWPWGAGLLILALCLGLVAVGRLAFVGATYFDNATTDANFTADILDPASNLDGGVLGLGQITLTWTATPDTYAAGYRVMRSKNSGPFLEVATVTPRTNTTYPDNLGILGIGSYSYYVIAYYESWNSVASNTITCSHAALLTLCP